MKPTAGRKFVRKLIPALLLLPLAAGCTQIGQNGQAAEAIDPPPASAEQAMLQETDSLLQQDSLDSQASAATQDQTSQDKSASQTQDQNADQAAAAQPQDSSANQAADPDADAKDQAANAASSQTKTEPESQTASAGKDELTVYLLDGNGYIAPMTLRTSASDDSKRTPEETAVAWMTKSADSADQLPPGFSAILPQTTKIHSIESKKGVVTIDFAAPFPSVPANQERKMVEALVWTMTELPGVQSVKLSVDGKALRELPASGLPLPETLSRSIGINLEQASGIALSRSMAVTLYFSARSEQGDPYFVPVTRLVNRQADRNQAALQELIKGPQDDKQLEPVLTEGVTIKNVSQTEDTVSASLMDPSWEPEMTIPSETMEALILTLTDSSGDVKASITINGTADFTDTDNRSYDKPVDRPTYINALSR